MIMYAEPERSEPQLSIHDLAAITKKETELAVLALEKIKGRGRNLWNNGHLSEPPNWDGFAVIYSSGTKSNFELHSCEWYSSRLAAFAAVMLEFYKKAGALPDPYVIIQLNGYLMIDFPQEYFYVGKMDEDQYSRLTDHLKDCEED